jgi:hypothetical protein
LLDGLSAQLQAAVLHVVESFGDDAEHFEGNFGIIVYEPQEIRRIPAGDLRFFGGLCRHRIVQVLP